MQSLVWFCGFLIISGASDVSGSKKLNPSNSPSASPELIQSFRIFLHKTLGPEGTYHRDLLISAGIIPPPTNYKIPKDENNGRPKERPLTREMYEHFKVHITDLLKSDENINYAINRLFGKRMANQAIDKDTSDVSLALKSEETLVTDFFQSNLDFKTETTQFTTTKPDLYETLPTNDCTDDGQLEQTLSTDCISESDSLHMLKPTFAAKIADQIVSSSLSLTEDYEATNELKEQLEYSANGDEFMSEYIQFLNQDSLESVTAEKCIDHQCSKQQTVAENTGAEQDQTSETFSLEYNQYLAAESSSLFLGSKSPKEYQKGIPAQLEKDHSFISSKKLALKKVEELPSCESYFDDKPLSVDVESLDKSQLFPLDGYKDWVEENAYQSSKTINAEL